MCVVVAEDPGSVPVVKREAVPDAVKCMIRRRNLTCLDLDPEAALLLQDAAVQLEKRFEADIGTVHRRQTISSDDNSRLDIRGIQDWMSAADRAAVSRQPSAADSSRKFENDPEPTPRALNSLP